MKENRSDITGGFIKGPNSAVYFTEASSSALKHYASPEDQPEAARYRIYGIAINIKAAFIQEECELTCFPLISLRLL